MSDATTSGGGERESAMAAPVRSCIVCRAERPATELVRLRERGGVVYVEGPGAGRGAWVCRSRACIEKVDTRALARAFKRPVAAPVGAELRDTVARVAEQKVFALLGLARRQGVLIVGQDRVASEPAGLVVAALDASERSHRIAASKTFGSSDELSRATGLHAVSVLGIAPGSLAQQAAYWLAVWYESRLATDRSGQKA